MNKKKSKLKIDANLAIAIGVLIASFGALFVSMKQASIMNEQTKILIEQSKSNAWPSLSIGMMRNIQTDGLKKFNFQIVNRGTGPAVIEQTIITYDGNAFNNWNDFYKLIKVPDSISIGHGNDILFNRIISPNENFNLVDWSNNKDLMQYIYERADKITIEICYRSVYDDYWKVKRTGLKNNLEKNLIEKTSFCDQSNQIYFQE
ncbi:hypothetical protein [Croceitalea sp. P059]|uniref:hypothetical protein n=1 Tax=Croceitalea sp. P059 TaxID=3075601 RepID=UPI002886B880|nr:hypothetical protein [Croceitalea sp. P059]MDT0540690.1 hypothetical protein [Croceitalea sp. P059]